MQQEDDLRALAKVMDFMRAISILFVLIHIYWFCYALIQSWGIDIGVVDRILLNFNRRAVPGTIVHRNQRYQRQFRNVEENRHPARLRVHTLLSELEAAQFQVAGCWNPVYSDLIVGIYIIAYEWRMDLAPDEKPSHG